MIRTFSGIYEKYTPLPIADLNKRTIVPPLIKTKKTSSIPKPTLFVGHSILKGETISLLTPHLSTKEKQYGKGRISYRIKSKLFFRNSNRSL